MTKNASAPAEYEVVQPREYGGRYVEEGKTVSLTWTQAKYYLPPLGSGLKPVGQPKQKPAKGAGNALEKDPTSGT